VVVNRLEPLLARRHLVVCGPQRSIRGYIAAGAFRRFVRVTQAASLGHRRLQPRYRAPTLSFCVRSVSV
jgi:hypothetical protein